MDKQKAPGLNCALFMIPIEKLPKQTPHSSNLTALKMDSRQLSFKKTTAVCAALVVCASCAMRDTRTHLENVAKGWCETIRASQIIPVYPLTEDLAIGDVFLVQTPVSKQQADYERGGFLPLDDHRVRLCYTNYAKLYFDNYWQDGFGKTPHVVPEFLSMSGAGKNPASGLVPSPVPRVAFPTYSFQAQSGFGLSAAFPIQGMPLALGYLGSDQVNGSVTIADARTYGGDEGELLTMLHDWAESPREQRILSETVRNAAPTAVYLRVVSRVYLARALEVSLLRARTSNSSIKVGPAGEASLANAGSTPGENFDSLLNSLNSQASTILSATQAGGALKFVAASGSSVGLVQAFDRLLVVGYLGFDVPVYAGGDLGVPIPTFQRLQGKMDGLREAVGPLSMSQAQFKANQLALDALAGNDPGRAMELTRLVTEALGGTEFKAVRSELHAETGVPADAARVKQLVLRFYRSAVNYVSVNGREGPRYARFNEAFLQSFSRTDNLN